MHRRISPILIAAALLSGGFPTRREEDEEPAKDPEVPERDVPRETYDGRDLLTLEPPPAKDPQAPPKRDDLPALPGTFRPVSETYERRYGRDLFAALEPLCATPSPVASRAHREPRPQSVKRTHAPRDRAAQRAAKKIKSAAKKRRGR